MESCEGESEHGTVSSKEHQSKEETRKRHLWDETDSIRSKVAKSTEKIIKMKIQKEAILWEINHKLQLSEENNLKLKANLHQQQAEYEKLNTSYQNLLATKENIIQKASLNHAKCSSILTSFKTILQNTNNIEEDKKNIFSMYKESKEQMAEIKANIGQLENKHSEELRAVQQKLEDKNAFVNHQNERIAELNNYLTLSQNVVKTIEREKDELLAVRSTQSNKIKELDEKLSSLQDKYNVLQEESNEQHKQMTASVAECTSKTNEIISLNKHLLQANNNVSSLNETIELLKEEKASLEKRNMDQQSTYENKLTVCGEELRALRELNDSMKQEINFLEGNRDKLNEECIIKKNALETHIKSLITENEDMRNKNHGLEKLLKEKINEVDEIKKELDDMKTSNQKLLEEIDAQAIRNKDDKENLKTLYLEKSRITDAKEMELNNKIKSLQNQIVIKSEEQNELEKQNDALRETVKKNNDWEQKYNILLRRHELTQRELRNLCTNEKKSNPVKASPLVESTSKDKELPSCNSPAKEREETKKNTIWKDPASRSLPKKPSFCSDSDESDCYRFDPRLIQKRFETLTKAEQKGTGKKTIYKSKK